MAAPPSGDQRIDLLVGVYAEAAANLARLLDSLTAVDANPRRFLIFQQIQSILRGLERETDEWSARFIQEFYEDADIAAVGALRASGVTSTLNSGINTVAVQQLVESLSGSLSKARESISASASKLFRATSLSDSFPALDAAVRRQVAVGLAEGEVEAVVSRRIASRLREQFRDDIVSVIGADGRTYTFPLSFYASMVSQNTKRSALSAATLIRAREGGADLVRVSAVPSSVGDYCDAYRGRVFSISGADPVYPPLDSTPNGGPPFHPWCRHSIQIFVPQFFTQAQQTEFAQVDSNFLMDPGKEGREEQNRIIRNWWQAKKINPNPAPLKTG